jgi:Na+-translocating ferredoxin:NAD+ oxidoreductase subunit D
MMENNDSVTLTTGHNQSASPAGTPLETKKLLSISASPHIRSRDSVPQIMLWVLVALLPAAAIAVVMSGLHALYSMALSIFTATAVEWVLLFFVYKKRQFPDGSAPVTGLLLALSLPPLVPLWVAPVGSLFAIAIVKMAFGGLGRNFLNPAMAGRAFLVTAFPAIFSLGALPVPSMPAGGGPEISSALLNFLTGYQCGWLGGTSAGALLIGAILLWALRIIDFTLPLSFIGTSFLLFWCTGESASLLSATSLLAALFQLLSGGILFGAIFLATDPVTTPSTARARLLFGIGCGAFTFLFHKFGSPNDCMMQAILIMNCAVPYMDRYLMHHPPRRPQTETAAPDEIIAETSGPVSGPAPVPAQPQELKEAL